MADRKEKRGILKGGRLVVKNKKFKRGDLVAFGICLFMALVIWIYATNVDVNKEKNLETLKEELTAQQA